MKRIIKILELFQNYYEPVSLSYLIDKFTLSIRTIQQDISLINKLLIKNSNCKIVNVKGKLLIDGHNQKAAITNLLSDFSKSHNENISSFYKLVLLLFGQKVPIPTQSLLNACNYNLINFKKHINLLNNYFYYYKTNLTILFRVKKGWILQGNEKDLRMFITSIFINQSKYPVEFYDSSISLEPHLLYIFNKLKTMLLNNSYFNDFHDELVWFLFVIVKRIKEFNFLNDFYYDTELFNKKIIEETNKLSTLLTLNFNLNFNKFELNYLNMIVILNLKKHKNQKLKLLKQKITNCFNHLIFQEYKLIISSITDFQSIFQEFLNNQFLNLYFNLYFFINPFSIEPDLFLTKDLYNWEISNIINFVFQSNKIYYFPTLLLTNHILAIKQFLNINENNWKLPIYYLGNTAGVRFNNDIKNILFIINNKYTNLTLNSLILNNNKLNLINKTHTIIIYNKTNVNLIKYQNIYPINYALLNNSEIELKVNATIKNMLLKKIISKILIFDFFLQQNFIDLNDLLMTITNVFFRQYKISTLFELENAFVNTEYVSDQIILIHKLIPFNNSDIPIILIYLKKPIIFNKKHLINFIFIIVNKTDTLYYNKIIHWFLKIFRTRNKVEIESTGKLYKLLNLQDLEY